MKAKLEILTKPAWKHSRKRKLDCGTIPDRDLRPCCYEVLSEWSVSLPDRNTAAGWQCSVF